MCARVCVCISVCVSRGLSVSVCVVMFICVCGLRDRIYLCIWVLTGFYVLYDRGYVFVCDSVMCLCV